MYDLRFLYTFFLSFDANFKLKQKERGIRDIELSPGWGCYVETSRYQKHIALHVDEPDVSMTVAHSLLFLRDLQINNCGSDHNAVTRANTAVPGYAVNGVGLGICSRHSLIRGNGVVDLPKGEK